MTSNEPMKRETSFAVEPSWNLVLHGLGVDKAELLARAGLPGDLLEREGARLSTAQFFAYWDALQTSVEAEAFALALVETVTGDMFAPCVFAALCSPTLAVALERLDMHKRLTVPMRLQVEREPEASSVEVIWLDAEQPPPASLIVSELAYLVQVARIATRTRVCPVALECQRPLLPESAYEQWFGVAPRVGTRNLVRFDAETLQLPFLTHNAGLWSVFEADLSRKLAELERTSTTAERTRAVLLQALPSGRGTLDEVAGELGLSTRTLQRQLRREQTSFKQVLRSTREQLARHYLLNTGITASEIGFLLGFDDTRSFFRAYNTWTGTTPESTRRSLAPGAARRGHQPRP